MLYGLCLTFCVSISDWFGWWIDQSICLCPIHRGRFGSTTSIAATNALTVVPIARGEMATNIAVPCFSTLSHSFLCTTAKGFSCIYHSQETQKRGFKSCQVCLEKKLCPFISMSRKHNKNQSKPTSSTQ